MPINPAPTIESFYKFCTERKLMGLKCGRCGKVTVPPRSACAFCGSTNLVWAELPGKGRLISYTVLHFAPAQFQQLAPYAVGIVEFAEGVRLMGMVRSAAFESLKVGMDLQVDFDTTVSKEWPKWPRYFFKPS